jgi:hypothetical protein
MLHYEETFEHPFELALAVRNGPQEYRGRLVSEGLGMGLLEVSLCWGEESMLLSVKAEINTFSATAEPLDVIVNRAKLE